MTSEEIIKEIDAIKDILDSLRNNTTIPFEIGEAMKARVFTGILDGIPLGAITSPSGGVTIDANARAAIDSIITTLERLGLIQPN